MRKILKVMMPEYGGLFAMCDDNTVWALKDNGTRWQRLADIPQDEHEESEPARPSKWRPAASLPIFYIPHDGIYAEECESEQFFLSCKGILPSITMIQAQNRKDALRIWRGMKDKSVETRIEKLKIGDAEYDYIVDCIPF